MSFIDKFKVVAWNIGFIESELENILNSETQLPITWMKHHYLDRFFADPFILCVDEKYITIMAEEYLFLEAKGKIVKLIIDRKTKQLKKRQLVLETDYHLSYPFIYNNRLYPEQSASNMWKSYDLDGKNEKLISRCGFIDGTILNDGNCEWLFATRIKDNRSDAIKKLYRYKIENGVPDISSERLIKDDLRESRPAGNFMSINNKWYRVSQTSTNSIYGESISISEIKLCNEENYVEETVKTINSHRSNRFNKGLHTLNAYRNEKLIVIDGFEMGLRPIQRIIIKMRSILYNDK